MTVYKVEVDLHEPRPFQWLIPVGEGQKAWELDVGAFHGVPIADIWRPLIVYVDHPKDRQGDFYHYGPGAFIINERARTLAATPLEMSGEFLPVTVEDREKEEFFVYNVTDCLNVLDLKNSKYEEKDEKGIAWGITDYVFHTDRFDEGTIFKIQHDASLDIFVLERTGDPEEEEFKALVDAYALKGLEFIEVWSDVKPRRKSTRAASEKRPSPGPKGIQPAKANTPALKKTKRNK